MSKPSLDARRVVERGFLESPDGTRWVRQDHALKLLRADRAAIRRVIKHKNNTKCGATTLRGEARGYFFNGYNKACIDILAALGRRGKR